MVEGMDRRGFLQALGVTGGALAASSLRVAKEAAAEPLEREAAESIEKDFTRRFLRSLAELLNEKRDRSDDIQALTNAYAAEFEQTLGIEAPYDTNLVYAAAMDNAYFLALQQPVVNADVAEYLRYQLHGALQFGIKSLRDREKPDQKNNEGPSDFPEGFSMPA